MAPKFRKYKLLLDEGLPPKKSLRRTNERYDIKHIRDDYKMNGAKDLEVYGKAKATGRLLVVFNLKHYRDLASKNVRTGIIGVSTNLSTDQLDKKLSAHLAKHTEKELFGKYTFISGDSVSES